MSIGLGVAKRAQDTISIDRLRELFPNKKNTITTATVDLINEAQMNPEFDGAKLIDTMVTYSSVMMKNRASMEQYLDAILFCSYLEIGDNNITAYAKAFAKRDFVKERLSAKPGSTGYNELSNAASRYRKSAIIRDILAQADVPLYLLFQGARYEAVALLAKEMKQAAYAKDRINAADKLLSHVKPPDNLQIEMDIGVKENSAVVELQEQLAELAKKQLEELNKNTVTLNELGSLKPKSEDDIIDVEAENE